MAIRYLIGSGNYSDPAIWSDSEFGSGGFSAPTSADSVFLSLWSIGKILNLDGACAASDMQAQSGSNTIITSNGSQTLTIAGGFLTLLSTNIVDLNITINITFNNSGISSDTALGTVNATGQSLFAITKTLNCVTFNRTAPFSQSAALKLTPDVSLNCTNCTLVGNSAISRLWVSTTIGNQAYINATNWLNVRNVNFSDITITPSVDFSNIPGYAGDAGNNHGITFTPSVTQKWSGSSGGTWSTNAWTTRVPLAHDDVIFDGVNFSSGSIISGDITILGRNIDFTGMTWTGTAPRFAPMSTNPVYIVGSFIWVVGMTCLSSSSLSLIGRFGNYILNTKEISSPLKFTINGPDSVYTLGSNLKVTASNGILLYSNFNDGGYSITAPKILSSFSLARTITKSGIWTLNSTLAEIKLSLNETNLIFTDIGKTIFTSTNSNTQIISLGNQIFNDIEVRGNGACIVSFSNACTIKRLIIDTTANDKTIKFTDGYTFNIGNIIITGRNHNTYLTGTSTAGWYLNKLGSGVVMVKRCVISYSEASPEGTWFYLDSTYLGNSGWLAPAIENLSITSLKFISAIEKLTFNPSTIGEKKLKFDTSIATIKFAF